MSHKSKAYFSAAKFTPSVIHNRIEIDIDELKSYFANGHPLDDCAAKWGCSKATIKRKLRKAGVDTSIYDHSDLAKERSSDTCKVYTLTDEQLFELFIANNLDTKTIAEMHDPPIHYGVVRAHVRRLRLRKDRKAVARSMSARHLRKHGYRHPSQRPDVLAKTRRSAARASYKDRLGRCLTFRSLHELGYALLLDSRGVEWHYEEMIIPYVDALTGKHRSYVIDFTVINQDGSVEWVEVKPNDKMIPDDKRIFASRRAEAAGVIYRGLTAQERVDAKVMLTGALDGVEFHRQKPRRHTKVITYYFKTADCAAKYTLRGWRSDAPRQLGVDLWARTFRR